MRHGTEHGYRNHLDDNIPFPEDDGHNSCGCRMAHRIERRGERGKAICAICLRRCIRRDDGLCGDCRKARSRLADRNQEPYDQVGLVGGEWVNDHGVMRWREKVS